MKLKKIRLDAGYLDQEIPNEGGTVNDSFYDRPVMMVYVGHFESMDGPVDITESHIERLASTHNSFLNRLKRMATGEVPMRDCPPIQLDHSPSAIHTIGRLVGELSVGSVDIGGEPTKALFGTVRFLGKENVEKAKDGRYTHVSIGADLENFKINELSVTPFPAAPNASLLKAKIEDVTLAGDPAKEEGEPKMHEKLKKHLMEHKKLSEQDAEKLAGEVMKHHMSKMEKSEEEMSKHMAAADDKEMSRMSEEHDKHMKHLAEKEGSPAEEKKESPAEEKKEQEAKMTAAKKSFIALAKGIKVSGAAMATDLRMSTISSKITKLRASGKITPAEIKKLDTAKLAAMSEEACEAALSTFDLRESNPLMFGSMGGSVKSETIEKVARKYRMQRLELESRLNMPSKRAEAEAMLSKLSESEKKEMAEVGGQDEEKPTKGLLHKFSYEDLAKMVDDKKYHEDLKKHLKTLMDRQADEHLHESDDKKMSALAKTQIELQNKFDELVSTVAPALGIKPEELKS